MKNKTIVTAIFLIAALLLSACATGRRPGFPRQSHDEEKTIREMEAAFKEDGLINEFYAPATTLARRRDIRDKLIDGRIALMDLHYNQFIAAASFNRQTIDTVGDATLLGLGFATTVTGGEHAKTVLAAAATGVTGLKLSVDKNFFYEKTLPVLVSTMGAQRKQVLVDLLRGRQLPVDQYTLAQAITDLNSYYLAGTFIGALQTIQSEAGKSNAQATEEIATLKFTEDGESRVLFTYVYPDGAESPPNTAHVGEIKTLMTNADFVKLLKDEKLPAEWEFIDLLYNSEYAPVRQQLAKKLGLN